MAGFSGVCYRFDFYKCARAISAGRISSMVALLNCILRVAGGATTAFFVLPHRFLIAGAAYLGVTLSLVLLPGLTAQGDPRFSTETAPAAEKELTPESFKKLHAMIKPHAGEAPWDEIPWIADLYEARQKAAAEGKPLFVWSASADSLGCT